MKLKVTLIVESPYENREATPEELQQLTDNILEDGDALFIMCEKDFDITIENHKEGA